MLLFTLRSVTLFELAVLPELISKTTNPTRDHPVSSVRTPALVVSVSQFLEKPMKRAFLYGIVAFCLSYPIVNTSAQTMSHDEEVVRNAYAKFSLLCSLPPVTNSAVPQLAGAKMDTLQLDAKVAKATPVFDLTGFQTGSVASIANDTWGTFVTPPPHNGAAPQERRSVSHTHENGR